MHENQVNKEMWSFSEFFPFSTFLNSIIGYILPIEQLLFKIFIEKDCD